MDFSKEKNQKKSGGEITTAPSTFENFTSDVKSVIKYPMQSLRTLLKQGHIPYNFHKGVEAGHVEGQPMDFAADMANLPGAIWNLKDNIKSGDATKLEVGLGIASVTPVGRLAKTGVGVINKVLGKPRMIHALTEGGIKKIPKNQTRTIQRVEDANQGLKGSQVDEALTNPNAENYATGGWYDEVLIDSRTGFQNPNLNFSKHGRRDNLYNRNLKSSQQGVNEFLPPNAERRLNQVIVEEKTLNKFRAGNPNLPKEVSRMSGGGANKNPIFTELNLPPGIANDLRMQSAKLKQVNKVFHGNKAQIELQMFGPTNKEQAINTVRNMVKGSVLPLGISNVLNKKKNGRS